MPTASKRSLPVGVALALAFLGFFEDELFKQVKLVVSGEAHRNRQLLGRMRQSPSQPFTLLPLLLALVLEVACFSTGAPASACKEMEPRHNFMPQNQHHDYQISLTVLWVSSNTPNHLPLSLVVLN
ncbi:hypothetical protein HPB51_019037 [Rhipicephalus microplus]|uniref:Uncharacterized protein n=1 Tax=Rhipicephalus microplus TaxID=6941 RepID=A0A9J6D6B3_RHIMP|nr:hypothetical protein HPB51_019037 [Rhipicephalus microplus]